MATAALPSKDALSKLDGILNCPICLDRYTDPRALPCLHTYCKKCIDNLPWSVYVGRGSRTVKCPECRRDCTLSKEGADTLPKAFHVHNLQEIKESLEFSTNELQPECPKHKKVKNLFCERCEELMCLKCSHESHSDHLDDIDEAEGLFDKHVRQIKASLQPVNMKINEASRMLARFDDTERNIKEKGEVVKKEIKRTIEKELDRFVKMLRKTKESLLEDTDAATRQKLELHSMERAELETVLLRLKSCKEFVEDKLKLRSRCQIQSGKKELMQRISDVHSDVKVSELQPGQCADTEYVKYSTGISPPNMGSVKSTLNYRSVHSLFSVDIPQCVLHGVTTEVSLMTSMPLSAKLVQCKLRSIDNYFASATTCVVEEVDVGHFKVLLNADQPGLYKLSVCIDKAHVHGSPFEVPVMSIAEWRGQRMKLFVSHLKHPRGVAVTDDGKHVIVTEWHGHRVAVFSATTGKLLYRIGQRGTRRGEFINPDEVEVSRENHIFVKDAEDCIQQFTLNGVHIRTVKLHYTHGEVVEFNYGLTILPCGSLLASVRLNDHHSSLVKIDLSRNAWKEFDSKNTFDGEATDLAVDSDNKIYVLTQNYGIHVLTPDGNYISSFGSMSLNAPYEFCIDSNNIIYVTEGKEVKIFTTDGRYMGSFGNLPKLKGIAVCKTTGDLYITKANGDVYVS